MMVLNTHQPILKNTLEIEEFTQNKYEDLGWLKIKIKSKCSKIALNVFAQLHSLPPVEI